MRRRRIAVYRRKASLSLLAVSLLSGFITPAFAQPPAVPPETLSHLIDRAAGPQDFAEFPELLAASLGTDSAILQEVSAREQEGPGTDQQNGATAGASGTTTLTEKPGIAELLNLAIENGAIIKTTSGTSFTLQTTPYLLYSRFGAQDTARTWDSLAALRRIALSATFNQGTSGADSNQNNFQSGEVKYTWRARSPRDKEFRVRLRSILEQNIDATSSRANGLLTAFTNGLPQKTQDDFLAAGNRLANWRKAQKQPIDRNAFLDELRTETETLRLELRPEDRAALARLVDALAAEETAFAGASQLLTKEAKKYLEEEAHPMYSVAYSFERDPTISDFSDVKAIFGYKAGAKLTFNLNGEVMLNNNRATADGTQLERVRAYSVAGDLTLGKFANDTADFTLAAKLTRPQGEAHNMASAQAKLNLYMVRGITIPVALTYSNRTESSDRSRVRLNVGVSLDGDTVMGIARNNP
jgi:hypothetical protein